MQSNNAPDERPAAAATADDAHWMRRARELALRAELAGFIPVGCVIVLGGRVIAEAEELVKRGQRSLAHAEFQAVEKALAVGCSTLADATIYTTAEPCIMCGFAIREVGIGRVVMGRTVGKIGAMTGSFPVLTTSEIERWGAPPQLVRSQQDA